MAAQETQLDYTYALLAPGQGNQKIGLGKDLADRLPEAYAVWQMADKVLFPKLNRNLTDVVWNGSKQELDSTEFAQLAIITDGLARYAALEKTGQLAAPGWHAGNSVGLITALVNAGALTIEAGVQLDKGRGEAFRIAVNEGPPTSMMALIDVQREIQQELRSPEGRFQLLTCLTNSDREVVLGGPKENIEDAVNYLKEQGLEDNVYYPIGVEAAFHSEYMGPAVPRWTEVVMDTPIEAPKYGKVMGGSRVRELLTVQDIKEELILQLTHRERFRDVVWALRARGVTTMTELNYTPRLTRMNIDNFRIPKEARPKRLLLPKNSDEDPTIVIGYRLINPHPQKLSREEIKNWYIWWIADRLMAKEEEYNEGMHFVEDALLRSADLKALRADLRNKFGKVVPDEEAAENTHIYMAVDATYRLVNTPSEAA